MPIYKVKCNECGSSEEIFRRVSNMDNLPICCNQTMERQICAPAVHFMQPYRSPVSGEWIHSPSQRRDDLARNGCRPYEGIETEEAEAKRKRQYADEKLNKVIDSAVAKQVSEMSDAKIKQLSSELEQLGA